MLSIPRLVLSASLRSAYSFGKRSFGHSVSYVRVNNCFYFYYYYFYTTAMGCALRCERDEKELHNVSVKQKYFKLYQTFYIGYIFYRFYSSMWTRMTTK
jgi:hypothetical protein